MKQNNNANPQDGTQKGDEGMNKAPNSLANMSREELEGKFKASAKGAQGLLTSNKTKDARIAELEAELNSQDKNNSASDTLYEGFEHLPEDERKNVLGLTDAIAQRVKSDINGSPVFQEHARRVNEQKFDTAFNMVASAYPELMDQKSAFKAEYFQPDNVPDNIESLIEGMAKIFLYDTARQSGIEEGIGKANHVDDALRTDGGSGGENQGSATHKSLFEWTTLQRTNPAKFASLAKQYDEDMASGKLK